MPLPDLIEIVPLDKPVRAEITVPGSKSITNRALILAALAEGEVTLTGALWSEDTQIMTECLQELGFMVDVRQDPDEACNRTITVYGKGGVVPPGGTEAQPLELFVGNAGTAARFLAAFVCLGKGVYRLHGVPRMHERPQAALFKALRELGYRVDSANDKLPATIFGGDGKDALHRVPNSKTENEDAVERVPTTRSCTVSIEQSSQFASALKLCEKVGNWQVEITGENADESPYVVMTSKMIEKFPKRGGTFQIEPDASSGSYFLAAADWVRSESHVDTQTGKQFRFLISQITAPAAVKSWPQGIWQIDAYTNLWMQSFATDSMWGGLYSEDLLVRKFGTEWRKNEAALEKAGFQRIEISREKNLGDAIMTTIVIAPFTILPAKFTNLGRLRVQECERVVALRTELTKCGAKVVEEGDTLTVYPSQLHGAEIETYHDHRMAMCFAILGLKVPGIKIMNPACVKKTFPNFFQKLAAQPPHGLGATILDAQTGRKLTHEELFAE